MDITIKYLTHKNCSLKFGKYPCGQNALIILDELGSPLLKASCAIPEVQIKQNQIIIKNWSENDGILDELIKNKILETSGEMVFINYVYAHICNLLVDPENYK